MLSAIVNLESVKVASDEMHSQSREMMTRSECARIILEQVARADRFEEEN